MTDRSARLPLLFASLAFGVAGQTALAQHALAQSGCDDGPVHDLLGTGTVGGAGVPALISVGAPRIGGSLALAVNGGASGAPALLVLGTAAVPTALPTFGAVAWPETFASVVPVSLDAGGAANPVLALDPIPVGLCGQEVVGQAVVFDAAAQGGLAFTQGLRLRFGVGEAPLFAGRQFGSGRVEAVGDLDGDAVDDAVVTNPVSGIAQVLIGRGDGGFDVAQEIARDGANRATLGDLDGDDVLDLVLLSSVSPVVEVRMGLGDGTLGAPLLFFTTSNGGVAEIADFDGDAIADLFVASFQGLVLHPGLGDGTFGPASLPAGDDFVNELVVGDLDLDGDPDVVASGDGLIVAINQGGGAFSKVQTLPVPVGVFGFAQTDLGDVDGDGVLDVAAVGAFDVKVFLGVGDGTFGPELSAPSGLYPTDLGFADFTGDGKLDLVTVSDFVPPQVRLLPGRGDGTFDPAIGFGSGPAYTVAIGDFDEDGRPDAVAGTASSSVSTVYLNDGLGGLQGVGAESLGLSPRTLLAEDFNGDGEPDLATIGLLSSVISVRLGQGGGSFGQVTATNSGGTSDDLAGGDLDGDGHRDLIIPNSSTDQVSVVLGDGTGAFGPWTRYPAGARPCSLALADFDLDGDRDVVAASCELPTFAYLAGNGDGTFAAPKFKPAAGGSASIASGDYDDDGLPDALVCDFAGNAVALVRGLGDGTFAAPVLVTLSSSPRDLVVADLDGDGLSDLALATDRGFEVALGLGAGSFAPSQLFDLQVQCDLLAVGDVDSDGRLDLVAAAAAEDSLFLLPSVEGGGLFGAVARFGVDERPRGLALADFDADGLLDLAATSLDGNSATLLMNLR